MAYCLLKVSQIALRNAPLSKRYKCACLLTYRIGLTLSSILVSCILLFAMESASRAQPVDAEERKNVLVLFDERDNLPGLAVLDRALRSTLESSPNVKVDVYSESLDRSRFQDEAYYPFVRDYLRQKYSRKRLDAIIAVMGPSLNFLMTYGNEIAGGAPIVFSGIDPREIENRNLGPNVTGVLLKRDFKGTLDVALRLQPDTQQVVFIGGTSDFDKRLIEQAKAEIEPYQDKLAINYFTDFELEELLDKVSKLPPKTVILLSTVFRDITGESFVPHEVAQLISNRANAPVYASLDQFLGRGIVGGHLYSNETHGQKAGELVLRLLEGQKVAEIPIVDGSTSANMFDSRELKRWAISEDRLPIGSIVQFKEPSAWELYRPYIAAALAILILQSVLIAWLLVTRARKRKAEHERSKFQALAAAEHSRLNEIVANTPGVVWEAKVDLETGERRLQFVSDYVEEMLGYSVDEWLETPGMATSLVADDDREMVIREMEAIVADGADRTLRFRWRGKDGRFVWVQSHIVPILDTNGKTIGLRGVALDITERKIAEEKLLAKEAQLTEAQRLAQVGSWEWDPAKDEVIWSEEIYRIYGLDPTLPPPPFAEHVRLWTPESWERLQAAVVNALNKGEQYELEIELIRVDDGRHLWGCARGEVIRNGDGITLRGTLQDITERRNADESLRAALDEISQLKDELHKENIYLKEVIKLDHGFDEIIGNSDALKYVLFKIEQVAPTDSTVLITGETGTGKELVARAIHKMGLRKDRPLVRVNCAALSASLIESELFGHERGAFTGAGSKKIGRFELADGATIFLDEVGELPIELQSKLLRLIQEGEFERLGSSKTIKADVRIIAATNRNLKNEVRNGRFRDDLLFRLNVFPITVPPLRERKEDIPVLIEHFTTFFSRKLGKTIVSISPKTMSSLTEYDWPGNVRELANVIERAVIGTTGKTLRVLELLETDRPFGDGTGERESLEEIERNHITQTLRSTGWRISGPNGAARILGLNPSTLRTRMDKLGIAKNGPLNS